MKQEPTIIGEHHLNRENYAYTVDWLRRVEAGQEDIDNVDWRTNCGVLALQIEALLKRTDH